MAFRQSTHQQRNGLTAGRSPRNQGGFPKADRVTNLQSMIDRVDRMIPPSPTKQPVPDASEVSSPEKAVQQTPRPQHAGGPQGNSQEFREQLWKFCNDGKFFDLSIECAASNGQKSVLTVSKAVISAGSPFFRQCLAKNPETTNIAFQQFPAEVVKAVVEFTYRGKLDSYALPGLHEAAGFFGLPELQKQCPPTPAKAPVSPPQQFGTPPQPAVQQPITKNNVIHEIIASLKAQDVKRQDEILAYVRANQAEAAQVSKSEEMSLLATSNPAAFPTVQGVLLMKF